jgi:hypothetical protein
LAKTIVVTEKIDGTNAIVHVSPEGIVTAGSRTRWITPESDNFGFAAWVCEHQSELVKLGPGYHYGEWWGRGIQRGYGLQERRFSLFNVHKWSRTVGKEDTWQPPCCYVVPVISIYDGPISEMVVTCLDYLKTHGSLAAPGFDRPEGVIAYHTGSGTLYKRTFDGDKK